MISHVSTWKGNVLEVHEKTVRAVDVCMYNVCMHYDKSYAKSQTFLVAT